MWKTRKFTYFGATINATNNLPPKKKVAKTTPPQGLTPAEEQELIKSIATFSKWLVAKQIIGKMPNIHLEDFPFSDADWTMKFNPKTGFVSFNTFTRQKCSFEYYTSIVLHEFFHLAVQKVPNKEDATKIKDDFGGELMKLIDIEADFYTALFYKEVWSYGLVRYLKIYHEGSNVFKDKWIRQAKLERFIGTLLSVCKMFIQYRDEKEVDLYDLYLVSISPLNTEENLHVLVIRREHIYFDYIQATRDDFIKIRDCYTNDDEFSFKTYAKRITSFICKALQMQLPNEIEAEIDNL